MSRIPIPKKWLSGAINLAVLFLIVFFASKAWCKVIVDHSGRRVDVRKPFERIISLYPAHTDNLFFLGQGDKLIGISRGALLFGNPGDKAVFTYHDDPERFMAKRPDLVLIRPMIELRYAQFVKKLEMAGITVVSLQPATVSEMYQYWKILGTLAGCENRAKSLVRRFKNMTEKIQGLTQKIPVDKKKGVYFEAIHSRMKTFSPDAMAIFVLEMAGGINLAADAARRENLNISFYGKERILSRADKIDVFLAQSGVMNPVTKEIIVREPGFDVIKAVKNNRVYLVDEKKVSRPTPGLLTGILEIGNILYPSLFAGNELNSVSPLALKKD